MKRGKQKKDSKHSERRPEARQALEKFGKWLLLFLIMGQNWPSVSAAAEGPHRRTEAVMRMQQEVQIEENRWTEATSKRWNRAEMNNGARRLRCTLLNGSWSTEKQKMRRYRGKCDIFFGIEHRLRNEEMEEQFDRKAKEGWRFAADAARITDGNAGTEDRKHTSGGVFVAVDSNLGAVVVAEERAISRAIRLELERLLFEKEAKRRFRRARALPCFLEHPRGSGRKPGLQPAVTYAAPVPVIEYVSPVSAVFAATAPENEYATLALLICRQERLPRSVVASPCERCLPIWSAHTELFSD